MSDKKVAEEDQVETDSAEKDSWRKWQWWLPYAGGISAFLILLGSLLTFSISLTRDLYRAVTSKNGIEVITFSSMAPQVFLNTGDGEVFISHIDVRGSVMSQTININKVVEPRHFLSVPVSDETLKELGGKTVLATNSDQEWMTTLETKIRGSADPSYRAVLYYAGSPELAMYKRVLNDKLRTFPASATLVYFTTDGQKVSKTVPVEGIVLH